MTTPTLPPLTRALVAGLAAGHEAEVLVDVYVFGRKPESHNYAPSSYITNEFYSRNLNAAARMEQRLLELGMHGDYAANLVVMALGYGEKSNEDVFGLATAPALLRVKAALLLFCEE